MEESIRDRCFNLKLIALLRKAFGRKYLFFCYSLSPHISCQYISMELLCNSPIKKTLNRCRFNSILQIKQITNALTSRCNHCIDFFLFARSPSFFSPSSIAYCVLYYIKRLCPTSDNDAYFRNRKNLFTQREAMNSVAGGKMTIYLKGKEKTFSCAVTAFGIEASVYPF